MKMLKTKNLLKLYIGVVIAFFSMVFVFRDVAKATDCSKIFNKSEEDSNSSSEPTENMFNVRVPSSLRIASSLDSDEYFYVNFDYFEDKDGDLFKDDIVFPSEKTTGFSRCYKKEFLDKIFDCLEKTKFYENKKMFVKIKNVIGKLRDAQSPDFDVIRNCECFKKLIRGGEFNFALFKKIHSKIGANVHTLLRGRNFLLNFLNDVKYIKEYMQQNNNNIPSQTICGKKYSEIKVRWLMERLEEKIEIKSDESSNNENITLLRAIEIIEKYFQGFIRFLCAECAYIEQKFKFPFDYFLVKPTHYATNKENLEIYENDSELKKAYITVEKNYRYCLGLASCYLDRYHDNKCYFNSCEVFTNELYLLDLHRKYVGEYVERLRCSKFKNSGSDYEFFCNAMAKYNENYCESFKELSNFCLNIEKESFEFCSGVLKKFLGFVLEYKELEDMKSKEELEIGTIKDRINSKSNGGTVLKENYKRSNNSPMAIENTTISIVNPMFFSNAENELLGDEQFEKYYGSIQKAIDGVSNLMKYINSGDFKKSFDEQYNKLKLECLGKFEKGVNDINTSSMSYKFSNLLKNNFKIIRDRIESFSTNFYNLLYKNTIIKISKFLAKFMDSLHKCCFGARHCYRPNLEIYNLISSTPKNSDDYENINKYYTIHFARPVFKGLFSSEKYSNLIANEFKSLLYSLHVSKDCVGKCKFILEDMVKKLLCERNKRTVNENDSSMSFEVKKVEPLISLFRKVIDVFEKYLVNYDYFSKKFNKMCASLDSGCKGLAKFKVNAENILEMRSVHLKEFEFLVDPSHWFKIIIDFFKLCGSFEHDLKYFVLYFNLLLGLMCPKNKEQDINNIDFTMPRWSEDYTINLEDYEQNINS